MFAVALWDARRRRLVLARDPFGIKPLIYARLGRRLAFASELKALLALPDFPRDIDPDAVERYLALNAVPAPAHDLPRGAQAASPGTGSSPTPAACGSSATRGRGRRSPASCGANRSPRWRWRRRERLAALRARTPAGRRARRRAAVRRDRLQPRHRARRAAAEDVQRRLRRRRVRRAGRRPGGRRALRHRPPRAAARARGGAGAARASPRRYDEPSGDATALPYWLLARFAARDVKAVLTGEGADELFGGYQTYVADRLGRAGRARRGGAGARGRALPELLGAPEPRLPLRRLALGAGLGPLERHHAFKETFGARAAARDCSAGRGDPLARLRARYAETEGAEPIARLQDVDAGSFLADDLLPQADRAGMAHGLEVRVPFLDPVVAELAYALPVDARVRGLETKRVLRAAAAPLLPASVVRGPKRGFCTPVAAWLRGPLEELARDLLSPARVARQGWFAPAAGHRAARAPPRPPRGPRPPAVGADRVRALARRLGHRSASPVPRAADPPGGRMTSGRVFSVPRCGVAVVAARAARWVWRRRRRRRIRRRRRARRSTGSRTRTGSTTSGCRTRRRGSTS